MSDDSYGWATTQDAPTRPTTPAPPGWYPDPWSHGQHRYWNGSSWTSGSFPHGPGTLVTEPAPPGDGYESVEALQGPPPLAQEPTTPPPPEWTPPQVAPPPTDAGMTWPAPLETKASLSTLSRLEFLALVVAVMLVVGSLATLGGYYAFRRHSPSTTLPPVAIVPTDPNASVLQTLVLTQADVPASYVVGPITGGDQVTGEPTLDLCNGTYPSESLRTARLQVAAVDGGGFTVLSTEAVLYKNPAATVQAFAELRSVAANCPSTPVVSPVGEPTATTHFNAAPDSSWPQTATVTRQAYDFDSTDALGSTQHQVAVYLRRGRALMGVYFSNPDSPQVPVAGQDTIEGIAQVFAQRMANLPASVVNG
ncbi:MAG TPA: DUF2510 domain-containing protein [Acidimicrobiales bacterium]|jgi:hypothetical protein|nr:DUF2510 domain-containing protein [Acidimicrobiales bacterium]